MDDRVSISRKSCPGDEFSLYLDGQWITSGKLEWCQKLSTLLKAGIKATDPDEQDLTDA